MSENSTPYPVLDNELERLNKLYHYEILGTKPEPQFDDLTELTAQVLGLPICQITLMDADWQDFLSNFGVDMDGNHREMSFCQHTVVQNHILEVTDTKLDERFKDHPLVLNEPHLRYYVGAPLIDDEGLIMGTLCGYGMEPHSLTEQQKKMLVNLAKTAIRLIKHRKINKDQEKYVNIFNLNQDLLCVIKKDGFFQLTNPAFVTSLGWTESELLTHHIETFIFKEDFPKVMRQLEALEIGKVKSGFSCRMLTKSGEPVWYDWSYLSDKDSSLIIASGHDMSKRMEVQKSLKVAVKELKKASKIKDEFLSNMSHEIRTPLTSIKGYSELVSKTELNSNQQQYLESIGIASDHLMNLVNDVLDTHKLDDGKVTLDLNSAGIRPLAEKVRKLFVLPAKKKELKLKVNVDKEVPEAFLLDETRLIQILTNLIGNSIKFTEEGHVELRISASSKHPTHALIKFEIEDTGIGMSPKAIKKVFKRFSQADTATYRLYGGTGLGLSISKRLVDLHNGKIYVESEEGKGTTFWFEIKLEIAEIVKESEPETHHSKSAGFKVLLAEDNEHLQLLSKIHIEKMGGLVDVAATGIEAVELVKENLYDLILMDVHMPELDGREATRTIREQLNIYTPVIGFSANSSEEEQERCRKAGMTDFIAKPFSINDLVGKIKLYTTKLETVNEFTSSIKTLERDEGKELVIEFIKIFKTRIPEDISELKEALDSQNLGEIKSKVHFLTSTMRTMKFKKGEQLTTQIEDNITNNQSGSAIKNTALLISYLEQALKSIV